MENCWTESQNVSSFCNLYWCTNYHPLYFRRTVMEENNTMTYWMSSPRNPRKRSTNLRTQSCPITCRITNERAGVFIRRVNGASWRKILSEYDLWSLRSSPRNITTTATCTSHPQRHLLKYRNLSFWTEIKVKFSIKVTYYSKISWNPTPPPQNQLT